MSKKQTTLERAKPKGPMFFLAPTCEIVDVLFNVMSPNADIKTEDGLSHSPGQTGLLGYSNFSSTPPSQSLYGYSHAHGQSHTPPRRTHTLTHTLHTPALISTLLEGAYIFCFPPFFSPHLALLLSATPVLH